MESVIVNTMSHLFAHMSPIIPKVGQLAETLEAGIYHGNVLHYGCSSYVLRTTCVQHFVSLKSYSAEKTVCNLTTLVFSV